MAVSNDKDQGVGKRKYYGDVGKVVAFIEKHPTLSTEEVMELLSDTVVSTHGTLSIMTI